MIFLKKVAADARILHNEMVAKDIGWLEVHCPEIAAQARPGMFVQIQIKDRQLLLRRPLSIALANKITGVLTFFYRVVGQGTWAMQYLRQNEIVNCLGPLGQGFAAEAKHPLLLGGGIGSAPLLYLAEKFQGQADIIIGGRNKAEMFWTKYYQQITGKMILTTDDGSAGIKGFAITPLPELLASGKYDYLAVCGPEIMMKAAAKIAKEYHIPCQVSLERRMGCGLGACLSCSIDDTKGQRKKVCKDGPVFWSQEVFADE